jgi:hypothetical protein
MALQQQLCVTARLYPPRRAEKLRIAIVSYQGTTSVVPMRLFF